MGGERGTTMMELVTVLAVLAIFAAVAVPSASWTRRSVSAAHGARHLALVLRTAQARAQSSGLSVRVQVLPDGEYTVQDGSGAEIMSGNLRAGISSTYPDGALEFSSRGWAAIPGTTSPRAGHFDVGSHVVIVQLSGCVRCA